VPDEAVLSSVDLPYMRLAVVRALNRLNVDRLDVASLVWYD